MSKLYLFLLINFTALNLFADLKSNQGSIKLDANNDNTQEATFTAQGLRLGLNLPTEKLDVGGNALINHKLGIGTSTTPSSNLGLAGTYEVSFQTLSSNSNNLRSSYLFADTSANSFSIQLPNPAESIGRIYHIKKINSSNNIIISSNTFIDSIDSPAIWVETGFGSATLLSQGTAWYLINSSGTITYPSWTPASLGNLIAWYDATDNSTLTLSGSEVTNWSDKSGKGHHLVEASSSKRPETNFRTLNGRNVLDFQANDYMEDTDFISTASGNLSVFIIAQPESSEHNYSAMISMNATSDFDWQFQANSAGNFYGQFATTNIGGGISASSTNFIDETHLFEIIFDIEDGTGTSYRYIDGALDVSLSTYSANIDQSQSLKIMSNRSGGSEINGFVGEIIICEDVDNSSRQKIEGFLAWKWGLSNQLSTSHPYKDAPPR